MGWASGSSLLMSVWESVRDHIDGEDRAEVLCELMHAFAESDCDTLNEVVRDDWPEADEAYRLFMEETQDE